MFRSMRVLPLALVSCLVMQTLDAQTVSGRLIDGVAHVPIDHAYIVLLNETDSVLSRVLTDAQGRFSLTAPSTGVFRLRSERIGFRAALSDSFELSSDGSHELEMLVTPVVVRLDTLKVSGDAKRCRRVGEQGIETATVWEEARKAFVGVVLGESQQTLTFQTRHFIRYFEANGLQNHEQGSTVRRARVVPYRSPSASQLQTKGYVIERGEGEDSSEFYAPDAEAFYSETFLQNHCFELHRDEDHAGLVGLVFEPTRGRDVPDVEGTLWLDEETAELRRLELRYTGLRSLIRKQHARAVVEFANLANGSWFVQQWMFRMPMVRFNRSWVPAARWRGEQLYGFKEEGSEVLRVLDRHGEVLFDAKPRPTERSRE